MAPMHAKAPRELPLVQDEQSLIEVCTAVSAAPLVALDTEFVRERTYYPQLCLLQVATAELIACVDCLAPIELDTLFAALIRDGCTWVLHSSRQDLEVVWNASGRLPSALVDTQIAGSLAGLPAQLSLQGLLAELVGVNLDKTETRTDWSRRPLSAAAIAYALDDVRYLLSAWRLLSERLGELDRLSWLEEDCGRLIGTPPASDAVTILERMRGAGGLAVTEQAAALELVDWRERRAQSLDRPRRWILGDEELLRIARAQPADVDALESIDGLPRKLVARAGAEIIAVLAAATPDTARVSALAERSPRVDKTVLKSLQADVRQRAERLGIEPEVLATRRELTAVAGGDTPPALRDGWRADVMREPN